MKNDNQHRDLSPTRDRMGIFFPYFKNSLFVKMILVLVETHQWCRFCGITEPPISCITSLTPCVDCRKVRELSRPGNGTTIKTL